MINRFIPILILITLAHTSLARGPRPTEIGAADLELGEAGVAWYTTWDVAAAEAARSNRPIFFMAAAAQCGSVSGVF